MPQRRRLRVPFGNDIRNLVAVEECAHLEEAVLVVRTGGDSRCDAARRARQALVAHERVESRIGAFGVDRSKRARFHFVRRQRRKGGKNDQHAPPFIDRCDRHADPRGVRVQDNPAMRRAVEEAFEGAFGGCDVALQRFADDPPARRTIPCVATGAEGAAGVADGGGDDLGAMDAQELAQARFFNEGRTTAAGALLVEEAEEVKTELPQRVGRRPDDERQEDARFGGLGRGARRDAPLGGERGGADQRGDGDEHSETRQHSGFLSTGDDDQRRYRRGRIGFGEEGDADGVDGRPFIGGQAVAQVDVGEATRVGAVGVNGGEAAQHGGDDQVLLTEQAPFGGDGFVEGRRGGLGALDGGGGGGMGALDGGGDGVQVGVVDDVASDGAAGGGNGSGMEAHIGGAGVYEVR